MKENKFKYTALRPKLPRDLEDIEFESINFEDEYTLSSGIVKDCSFDNQEASSLYFKEMVFINVDFSQVSFKNIELIDVRFENCDLSNADFMDAIIHRVEFIKCKTIGLNLSEATLRNVIFEGCNGSYGFFGFADCKQVDFNNCQLTQADFHNCNINKVTFNECNLRQAQMSGAKLNGIDLTTCNIDGIGVEIKDIYGAIVSMDQALSLSRLLGITIKM